MYRVYLRRLDGQLFGESSHPVTAEQARQAFAALVGQTRYTCCRLGKENAGKTSKSCLQAGYFRHPISIFTAAGCHRWRKVKYSEQYFILCKNIFSKRK